MISRRKFAHHFLPHFYVDLSHASVSGRGYHFKHNDIHHRAHALSIPSLFVYLQILVIVTATLYFIRIKAPQILGQATFSADQVTSLTNQKRQASGLTFLTYNPLLAQAAAAKAANMFSEDYWAHNSPSGKTPWSFITASGYRYVFAGENLARDFDNAGSVVEAWMNSPSHRSNLLDKNFKEIGVAVVSGKLTGREGILVVQMFGASVSQVPAAQSVAAAKTSPSPVTSPKVQAKASSSPTILPSPTPVIVAQNLLTEIPIGTERATILGKRQFSIAKGISLGLIGFIFTLFALEVLVTFRRAHVTLRSGVLAHLALLGFVLLAIWYAVGGAIL